MAFIGFLLIIIGLVSLLPVIPIPGLYHLTATIKGIGKAVMAFTKWRIDCSETIVLKIKPEPGSKIQVNLPEEAMYTEARSDSISFLYKKQGYLIFYT